MQKRPISELCVWISGAANGIGRLLVESLVVRGCKGIAIVDIVSESDGNSLVSHLQDLAEANGKDSKILFYSCDIRDKASVEHTLFDAHTKFSGLNTIVNNAGVLDENDLYRAMNINAIAHIRISEFALKLFSSKETSKVSFPKMIVNVASAAGLFDFPKCEYYTASKHALVGYSRSISTRALEQGTHVICVCPAFVALGMGLHPEVKDFYGKIEVMDPKPLIHLFLHIFSVATLAGEVIYISQKTGVRLARVSLRKFPNQISKL